MPIRLAGCDMGCRYAAIARDIPTVQDVTSRKLNALIIGPKSLTLFPDSVELSYPEHSADFLEALKNYDVVEIGENGALRPLYARGSNSNCIVVTSMCNSNCVMCPSPASSRQRRDTSSIEDLCRFVEYIPKDATHITVTGGEPTLLKEDLFVLMDKLNAELPTTGIQYLSNGRAFDDPTFAEKFSSRATTLTRVSIPIHASMALLHDRITQVPGSFEQTVSGIQNLEPAAAEIEVRVVVSRLNAHDLSAIAEFVVDAFSRVTCVTFIALEMSGSAAVNRDTVWIDYKTAAEEAEVACVALVKRGVDVNLYNFPLCSVDEKYWSIARQSISDFKVHYDERCGGCCVKEICGGEFMATAASHLFQPQPVQRDR